MFLQAFSHSATRLGVAFPFFPKELALRASNHDDQSRGSNWMVSLKTVKIINITTIAKPIRKPISCARADKGRPRDASMP
jgi:hypothetical protein